MGLRFGFVTWQAQPFAELLDTWLALEAAGIDNAWVIDHIKPEFAPDAPLLESWTVLAALAARTSTIRVGTAVNNAALRNPAMLCKQAITVDRVSDGRLDMAVGAGYYESEQRILGIEYPDTRGRAERLHEVVEVLAQGLHGEPVTLDGRFWRLDGVPMLPGPVQAPRVPLWVAANGARSIRTAALHADVMVTLGDLGDAPSATLPKLRQRFERLGEHCREFGRDPAQVRRAYFVGWADEHPFESADAFQDFVGSFVEAGVTDFMMVIGDAGGRPGLERVASWIQRARALAA